MSKGQDKAWVGQSATPKRPTAPGFAAPKPKENRPQPVDISAEP